jgi:hypothetical protein
MTWLARWFNCLIDPYAPMNLVVILLSLVFLSSELFTSLTSASRWTRSAHFSSHSSWDGTFLHQVCQKDEWFTPNATAIGMMRVNSSAFAGFRTSDLTRIKQHNHDGGRLLLESNEIARVLEESADAVMLRFQLDLNLVYEQGHLAIRLFEPEVDEADGVGRRDEITSTTFDASS